MSLSNYLSASSIGGIKALHDAKLQNNIDFKLVNTNSHISAIMSVVVGDADVAITTNSPLIQLTDESVKSKIRYFESGFDMPHLFTIANPKLSKEKIKAIKTALLKFEASPSGQLFFKDTGFQGYAEITKKDTDAMKPVLKETKGFLGIK
ncbi:MAG: PhnD/SsuA/transferrin family substrate-binding protein [Arcobacter sp.]|nr:PhnD/SsuA/transferrin family substrate-binding protein [Arcobacter sp.]